MIGWYVHHHGRGHLTRAQAVRARLTEPVVVLSSLPAPPDHDFAGWVQLDRDDGDCTASNPTASNPTASNPTASNPTASNPTANGRLHWVPTGHPGLARRSAQLTAWIADESPRVMVVDVSVEVTLLCRLSGAPVVVFAGPGDRDDDQHRLAYDVADRIVAPWARAVYDPAFLQPHAAKTTYVGAFSRFDGLAPLRSAGDEAADAVRNGVVVLNGAGGTTVGTDDLTAARAATPHLSWSGLGLPGQPWRGDVWSALSSASVVVTHAGQNALAEVAAARRPAVVVAQERPFGEQHRVTEALTAQGIAVGIDAWPPPHRWPALIAEARDLGGDGWQRWSSGHGAADAAAVITSIGTGGGP